ncbi:MAG: ATP-binding protein, partial [Planctomycetota bacterium]
DVFVDSAQVVSALSNILCNSLESYDQGTGPAKVTAEPEDSSNLIQLQIIDSGCGMDAQTLQKATQPFFSAKPAGRKRGMGLAHAQRILQLNGGSLTIQSSPGIGTSVTILLPRS